ncbi:phage tail protein [Terriglobus tenax]|uniref:phage tail protein n=1 Tax=Terriglobus tenax TaxID=1111115 RepID=UPI0021DF8430|nr:tail fiber protein [Terriglobus tenax]
MADPFIGEIRAVGFDYAPADWAPCDGRLLQVSQYQALFALLGTMYGGNGTSTFGLPDLRGRSVIGAGIGANPPLAPVVQGTKYGAQQAQLLLSNMPTHNHIAMVNDPGHAHLAGMPSHTHTFAVPCAASATTATSTDPNGNVLCTTQAIEDAITNSPLGVDPGPLPLYASTAGGTMASANTGTPSVTATTSTSVSTTGISVVTANTGSGLPFSIQSPGQGLYYIIALLGIWPTRP